LLEEELVRTFEALVDIAAEDTLRELLLAISIHLNSSVTFIVIFYNTIYCVSNGFVLIRSYYIW